MRHQDTAGLPLGSKVDSRFPVSIDFLIDVSEFDFHGISSREEFFKTPPNVFGVEVIRPPVKSEINWYYLAEISVPTLMRA